MAVYPTDKGSPGTWGAECSAYHAVSTDLDTGKIKDGALQVSSAAPTVDAALANKKYVDDSTNWSIDPMTGLNNSEGTITFPNGMIQKWGKTSRTGNDTIVTFASAFPDFCFQVICGNDDSSSAVTGCTAVDTISKTGFAAHNNTAGLNGYRWFAIGR